MWTPKKRRNQYDAQKRLTVYVPADLIKWAEKYTGAKGSLAVKRAVVKFWFQERGKNVVE